MEDVRGKLRDDDGWAKSSSNSDSARGKRRALCEHNTAVG